MVLDPGRPRISVVVAARRPPAAAAACLASLAAQPRLADIEVLVADGSPDRAFTPILRDYPGFRHLSLPGGNLPELKAEAIRNAHGPILAILDPSDAADSGWVEKILTAFDDASIGAVGGTVELAGPSNPGNVAGYLFEYGAFSPPLSAGDAPNDLPGNNVAYRRGLLVDDCADLLASEGFHKPLFHRRIRELGYRLVIRPDLRVRHLTRHTFVEFGIRRWHYGRCFGALRYRHASPVQRLLYVCLAPAAIPLLIRRHLMRAWSHPTNRKRLPTAALALVGVCICWGCGEWIGCWFGPGRSCGELH